MNSKLSKESLKIVFIVTTVDGYGADKSMMYNVVELKKRGKIDPIVVIPRPGLIEEDLRKENIKYYICSYKSWTKGYKLNTISFLKPALKKANNYFAALSVFLIHLRRQRIQFVHTNTFTTDFGLMLSKFLKAKHIMHIREIPYEQFNFDFEYPEDKIYNLVAKNSALILCNSKYTYNYFYKKMGSKRLTIVPNPVFKSMQNKMPGYRHEGKKIKFIVIGRYEPSKNQYDVLRASKKLVEANFRNFEVHFFGTGPLEQDYKTYIRCNLLENVIFIHPYKKDIFETIAEYDAGIISSRYEAFGRVTVEFMVNGLPVIGNNTGNTPYLINDGYNGFIYSFNDETELADKMKKFLLEDGKTTLRRMSQNAHFSVGQEYSFEQSSETLYNAYLSCI